VADAETTPGLKPNRVTPRTRGLDIPTSDNIFWSPKGDRIAFELDGPLLYAVRPTGDALVNLNTAVGLGIQILDYSWAPDGSYLAISSWPTTETIEAATEDYGGDALSALDDAFFGIYTVEPDGSNSTHILAPTVRDALEWVGFVQQER
jgi:Tol biopolymer transport system component